MFTIKKKKNHVYNGNLRRSKKLLIRGPLSPSPVSPFPLWPMPSLSLLFFSLFFFFFFLFLPACGLAQMIIALPSSVELGHQQPRAQTATYAPCRQLVALTICSGFRHFPAATAIFKFLAKF